ncbi:MAG: stage III sporulation protein AF [Clostridium sp.]|nr:stage III sporulation protein AF [Clostridium sp.]
MEAVYSWVKSIIYYMIFLSVANNLLADSKYEKYVRFFAGMVLVLLVVSPFTGSLRLDEPISALFRSITFQNDAEDLKVDLWGMEDRRLEQIIRGYEEAVEKDVAAMAEAEGFSCTQARVTIDGDRDSSRYGQVTDIQMELQKEARGAEESGSYIGSRPVNVESNQIDSIQVEPVALGEEGEETVLSEKDAARDKTIWEMPSLDNGPGETASASRGEGEKTARGGGKTEGQQESGALQSKINGLTGKVASYYGLERSHIQVWWKND